MKVVEPEMYSLFVSFYYKGQDNGVPKEGFDSRVIMVPKDANFTSSADLKEVADALANSEFNGGKRYVGLEISLINIIRLPV